MTERWKPEVGGLYWLVAFNEAVSSEWRDDNADFSRWRMGNCFKTKEEAATALEKFTALLLSLHEPLTECNQLPKLTAEVFDRTDCPEWAKYAAVDGDGMACYYANKPTVSKEGTWWSRAQKCKLVSFWCKFDASNWQNSLIARNVKLPDWCKVGAIVYMNNLQIYKKIENEKELAYIKENNHIPLLRQARLRPYNAEEMKALVGKIIVTPDSVSLIYAYDVETEKIEITTAFYDAQQLLENALYIDGKPCGVLEHLENGEWVE